MDAEYSCYQCISTSDNEGDCDESDLDKLAPFIKPCPRLEEGTFKGSEAKACRKIVQTVETKKSIIRECAYSGDVVDGQKKTGNWGINMYYYQCENTGDEPCNSTRHPLTAVLSLMLSLVALLFM
ncbi:hypothetical protein Y032_0115g516 [Ancylostoma ceylanicum]|uniref:Protein quiver n=1 Tax=Ancylostoma ceylanicum TaxID=53326 RepID=A0A016TD31_9BILA|nr:hypothetical protein Y032_0115g516 [Ancylostoma ceylanicum]